MRSTPERCPRRVVGASGPSDLEVTLPHRCVCTERTGLSLAVGAGSTLPQRRLRAATCPRCNEAGGPWPTGARYPFFIRHLGHGRLTQRLVRVPVGCASESIGVTAMISPLAALARRADAALVSRFPEAWPLVRARFTPGARFGLGLTVALAFVWAGFWAFFEIVELWAGLPALGRLDAGVQAAIARVVSPGLTPVVRAATELGGVAWTVVAGVGVAVLLWRRHTWWFWAWAGTLGGGEALVWAFKTFYHRARPLGQLVPAHGYSFPSGHSTTAMLIYGFAAVYAWAHLRGAARVAAVSVSVLLILVVGFSRMYLDVHFATDVLGGVTLGATWLVAALALARIFARPIPISR